jgi:hypothetical protein
MRLQFFTPFTFLLYLLVVVVGPLLHPAGTLLTIASVQEVRCDRGVNTGVRYPSQFACIIILFHYLV